MPKQKLNLKKLPSSLLPIIVEYAAARDARRALEAEARATAKTLARAQSRILTALDDAEVAVCGDLLVTAKRGEPIGAVLTLNDQSTLAWDDVKSLTAGDRVICARDVVSLYGGRAGSVTITAVKREKVDA